MNRRLLLTFAGKRVAAGRDVYEKSVFSSISYAERLPGPTAGVRFRSSIQRSIGKDRMQRIYLRVPSSSNNSERDLILYGSREGSYVSNKFEGIRCAGRRTRPSGNTRGTSSRAFSRSIESFEIVSQRTKT